MKKNVIQYTTLLLVFILLPLTILQGIRLEQYRVQLDSEFQNLENRLTNAIDDVLYDVRNELEESSQPVENYDISLGEIDFETRSIQLNATVTLKQWSEDSLVSLVIADDELRKTIQMTTDGTGTFSTTLSVPLEEAEGFLLKATVTTGGVSTSTDLGGYPDIYSLLPLRTSGLAWTEPAYDRGVLKLDFEYFLEWQYDQPGIISDARFEVYVNDALMQTLHATEQPDLSFRIHSLEVTCAENDVVLLVFRCVDSFGLEYIFPCTEFILENGMVMDTISMDSPQFHWVREAENCDH